MYEYGYEECDKLVKGKMRDSKKAAKIDKIM